MLNSNSWKELSICVDDLQRLQLGGERGGGEKGGKGGEGGIGKDRERGGQERKEGR